MSHGYAYILLAAGILIIISMVSGRFFSRFGLSSLLVPLGIGMVLGNGGAYDFNYNFPVETLRVSEIALCTIIFAGGFESDWNSFRFVFWQGISMSTLGVLITTVITGAAAHLLLGWDILFCLLIGAAVSSTDAAAVFSILAHSSLKLKKGISEMLELESGTNDPMAWFLTVSLTTLMLRPEMGYGSLALAFLQSMGIGLASGLALGKGVHYVISKVKLKKGQNPVILLALVLILYSFNTLCGGSAFLAVYVAGILLGNSKWHHRDINQHFFEGMSWLMETVLVLILGLQVYLLDLGNVVIPGLMISAVLMFAARPVGVFVSLVFFPGKQFLKGLFLSWVGLRGATPIVFALIPVVHQVPGASTIFNLAFVVVITSLVLQGTTVGWVSRLTRQQHVKAPERAGEMVDVYSSRL